MAKIAEKAEEVKGVELMRCWEEVDLGLKKMRDLEANILKIESKITEKQNAILEKYQDKLENLKAQKEEIEQGVLEFSRAHHSEIKGRRLAFGKISYKKASSIQFKLNEEDIIPLIKEKLGDEYLRIKESVNKTELAKLSDEDLRGVACFRDQNTHYKINLF